MLRTADKRLFISERMSDVFGGRGELRVPTNRHPARLKGSAPPVGGYTGWWDSAQKDSLIVSSTGRIKAWMDLTASGYHLGIWAAVAALDDPGPIYSSRTINGILVPDFQANGRFSMASAAPRDDRSSCTFVVCETDTVAAGIRNIIGANGTNGCEMRLSANDLQTVNHNTLLASIDNLVTANTPFVGVQNLTASDVTQYVNGTSETDAHVGAFTAGRTMMVGSDQVNGQPWDGAIAEILYYPDTLSGGDVTLVVDWMKAKWGIA